MLEDTSVLKDPCKGKQKASLWLERHWYSVFTTSHLPKRILLCWNWHLLSQQTAGCRASLGQSLSLSG